MIDVTATQVWLAPGATDMRRSIDGLAILAQNILGQSPFDDQLFVFCGRDRKRLKMLYWDRNGFWLFYRRLETGRFRWPDKDMTTGVVSITRQQLHWLLEGLSTDQPRAHRPVSYQAIY